MKSKTEWVGFAKKMSRPRNFWIHKTGRAMFGYIGAVRWVNIFNQDIEDVELQDGSKIIGDA